MWTREEKNDIVENATVNYVYKNGELMRYEINPLNGYVLRIENCDQIYEEEEKILIKPYRTKGEIVLPLTYDFEMNSKNIYAELYVEGMEDEIIEIQPENNDIPELTEDTIEKAKAYDILVGASE